VNWLYLCERDRPSHAVDLKLDEQLALPDANRQKFSQKEWAVRSFVREEAGKFEKCLKLRALQVPKPRRNLVAGVFEEATARQLVKCSIPSAIQGGDQQIVHSF
jgi:hypothetical protein